MPSAATGWETMYQARMDRGKDALFPTAYASELEPAE
jgi:hypothetical protein